MDRLADYIVRPVRRPYNPNTDLGPELFTINYTYYGTRTDFEVKNRRLKTIQCSLFHHSGFHGEKYPLMVYCHGNSGNRTYSYEIVYKMLKSHISVLTFDFAGCGLSDGKFISLGHFEQFDIDDVLEYALQTFNHIDPERIGIWGRSMGAVAALLYASRNNNISLIVLDSPFKDFSQLLKEYIHRFKIISLMGKYIYNKLRRRVLHKAHFDFEDLKPIEHLPTCTVPAFFYHTTKDKIVPRHHSKELFEAYPAEKEYFETKGGHNSKRPDGAYEIMSHFVRKVFMRKGDYLKNNKGGSLINPSPTTLGDSKPLSNRGNTQTSAPSAPKSDSLPKEKVQHEDKKEPENIMKKETDEDRTPNREKTEIGEFTERVVMMKNEADEGGILHPCKAFEVKAKNNSFSQDEDATGYDDKE